MRVVRHPAAEGEDDQQRNDHPDPRWQADHHKNDRYCLQALPVPAWRSDHMGTGQDPGGVIPRGFSVFIIVT